MFLSRQVETGSPVTKCVYVPRAMQKEYMMHPIKEIVHEKRAHYIAQQHAVTQACRQLPCLLQLRDCGRLNCTPLATMALTYEAAYYILQLPVGAPLADVRSSYKRLALQWHPDKQPAAPDASSKAGSSTPFTQLQEAYQLLCQAADAAAASGAGAGPGSAGTGLTAAQRQQLLEEALAAGLLSPAALLAMQQQLEAGGPCSREEEALWAQLQRRLARRQQRAGSGSYASAGAADAPCSGQDSHSRAPASAASGCMVDKGQGEEQQQQPPAATEQPPQALGSKQQGGGSHGLSWLLGQVWGSTAACRVVVPLPQGGAAACASCQQASHTASADDPCQQQAVPSEGLSCSCGAASGVVRYSWRVYWVWARRLLLLRVAAGLLHSSSQRRRRRVMW